METTDQKTAKIYLACDHAGFNLKEQVKKHLMARHYQIADMGTDSLESANYIEFGARAAREVSQDPGSARAILICGSGIGMSMVANKFKNVRAALCHDEYAAEMSRRHNNANVLTLGARVIDPRTALNVVDTWLDTEFDGGRHQLRLEYLHQVVEQNNFK
jgi:RpiB/LacA/LacB family sugar-phosphate isomerase